MKILLERGVFWRDGNGEKIRITKDRWVPEAAYHPIQLIVFVSDDLRVSSLVDKYSNQLNEELVHA